MALNLATQHLEFEFRGYLERPSCPRCGTFLHTAESAQFRSGGHVSHLWSCEDCGEEFETSVSFG